MLNVKKQRLSVAENEVCIVYLYTSLVHCSKKVYNFLSVV